MEIWSKGWSDSFLGAFFNFHLFNFQSTLEHLYPLSSIRLLRLTTVLSISLTFQTLPTLEKRETKYWHNPPFVAHIRTIDDSRV